MKLGLQPKVTDRFFDTGITQDNPGSSALQNQNEFRRATPPPPSRESLIDTHNLDHSDPAVISALDRYEELKAGATIPDFLGVIGERIVAPFKKPKEGPLVGE